MSEVRSSPSPETAGMPSSAGAANHEIELSDEELEHVVGGLARAWLVPGERPSIEAGSVTGAHAAPGV